MADFKNKRTKKSLIEGIADVVSCQKEGCSTIRYKTKDGAEHIKYHDTIVLTTKKNGTVVLNSGGFRTSTTKSRINDYQSTVRLWQDKGHWYCGQYSGPSFSFYDGIAFTKEGGLIGGKRAKSKARTEENRIEKTVKQIQEYCKALKIMVDAGRVPRPELGDCIICRVPMFPLSCIQIHLDEKYIHGTLIYNAIKWSGRNPDVIYGLGFFVDVVSTVRRYLRYQMGVA